jgi:phosphoribosyl-ATP pyrophosphohydrolase
MTDSINRLYRAVVAARSGDPATSRTARLLQSGRSKMAKKMVEEAIEVVIDILGEDPDAAIKESADLVYNLVVVWAAAGIEPSQVWAEMERREREFGIAEKLPKAALKLAKPVTRPMAESPARRKVVALETRRVPKRS